MYNKKVLDRLLAFISSLDPLTDKNIVASQVCQKFLLKKERSVYTGPWFSIRFCSANSENFANTVLALSVLRKYDHVPFIVCLITPLGCRAFLANSTFLKKISHSSQALRCDNVKGSFNGCDILQEFEGIQNSPQNFESLFAFHENSSFEENLPRLVEATNNISPTKKPFLPTKEQLMCIKASVQRAISFMHSDEYKTLRAELDSRVQTVKEGIRIAASIDNVNLRGRIIESLITAHGEEQDLLLHSLLDGGPLPKVLTLDNLGDYTRDFPSCRVQIDIKTKLLYLASVPKGYNVDKILSFLAEEKSVYLVYLVAIDEDQTVHTRLCSMFNRQLLDSTRIIKHWAGRGARGVTQYDGRALEAIIENFDPTIDPEASLAFLSSCLEL